jgi:hypothetical protein
MADLDQGGANRRWVKEYLGPSIGWIEAPAPTSTVPTVTASQSPYNVDLSTTLVAVGTGGGPVTINLPFAQTLPAISNPRPSASSAITIVDVGGNAAANNITIVPQAGETIMGLASIKITANYGGFTLQPIPIRQQWQSISP